MNRVGYFAARVALWGALCALLAGPAVAAAPPAQKLPSALLVYPLIEADAVGGDTRIELVNLTGASQQVQCFYVYGDTCSEIGFFLALTPYQPMSWFATQGLSDISTGSSAPPFVGAGELKCAVTPPESATELSAHNTIQGRATVFRADGKTVSYGAVGFQRLNPGPYTGEIQLNGSSYAQCPDKLHFDVFADQPTGTPPTASELILLTCSQDLVLQAAKTITVQLLVVNEFEQTVSLASKVTCFGRSTLGELGGPLERITLGSQTAHLIVRGSEGPLLGLVIDEVPVAGQRGTAGNEPSFQGGRSATVLLP